MCDMDVIRRKCHELKDREMVALWRTWSCGALHGCGDVQTKVLLVGLLRRALRAADPEAASVVTQSGPNVAPLAAALRVKPPHDQSRQDIFMSWLLVHALTGQQAIVSMITIAETLQRLGLRRLSLGWQRQVRLDLAVGMSLAGSPLAAVHNLGKWRRTVFDAVALAKGQPVGQGDEAALREAFEAGVSVRKVKAALERALARGAAEGDGPAMH